MTITIGADPEFFLKRGNSYRSSIGKIGGSKQRPAPLGRDGFFIQEDNVAVEFNVPPAADLEEWASNIEWSIREIGDKLRSRKYTMAFDASAVFTDNELRDPAALVFGCDPDFNAWNCGMPNPRPSNPDAPNLRTCGGHVHIGYPEKGDTRFRWRLIQAADMFLGVPSVLSDSDARRASLYGKAGAFRPTTYGAEYRVLSNFWLAQPISVRWVFTAMQRAYEFVKTGAAEKVLDSVGDEIQSIINTRNVGAAKAFMQKFAVQGVG